MSDKGFCTQEGCDREWVARKLCHKHYQAMRKERLKKPVRTEPRTPREAFEARMGSTPPASGCWLWVRVRTGEVAENTAITVRGKGLHAHRIAYTIFCGKIRGKKIVSRTCGHEACVQPAHLRLVDKPTAKGVRRRISDADVIDILCRYGDGLATQKSLAKEYGISPSTVCCLVKRRRRKYLTA